MTELNLLLHLPCASHLYALLLQLAIAGIPTRHSIGNAQLMSSYSILFWCLYSLCSPGPDLLTNFCFQCRTIPWWASLCCLSWAASERVSTVSWRNARVELFPSYSGKLRQSLNRTGEIVSTCLFRVLTSFSISNNVPICSGFSYESSTLQTGVTFASQMPRN